MNLRVRFATRNVPESGKRGLLRDRLTRARRSDRLFIRRRIDVEAKQEAGTYAEKVDGERPVLKSLWARANSLVRGRQVGNGITVKRRRWKAHLLDDLTIGDLHIAVALITHRRTGWAFKFYAVHRPTRRATNNSLRDVIDDALREHTRRDDAAGLPWVIAGDMNQNPWGWGVKLGAHSVDHIRGSKHFEPLGQTVVDRPALSDHKFLIADAAVEV